MPDNLVLCYHALSPSWQADLCTTPERFERQVRLLLRRGYRPARFSEAVHAPAGSGALAVTFDDAFASVHTLGLAILRRLGAPATVFVPTDYIDSGGPLRWAGIDHWLAGSTAAELTPMSWAQIGELHAAGWEIGSHTGSHPRLTRLDDTSLADELARSRTACEQRLSAPCTSLAYPYGDVDARVIAAAGAAGYTTAAGLPGTFGSRDRLEWPRIGVYHSDDARRFRLKVSPPLIRLRASRGWDLLQAARAWSRRP